MGLFGSAGLKNAFSVGALLGQDITARSITLTRTAAGTAIQLVAGALLRFSAAGTDTLTGDGTSTIIAGGTLRSTLDVEVTQGRALYLNGATRTVGFSYDGTRIRVLVGTSYSPNVDQGANLGEAALQWSSLFLGGSLALASSDSSGTPGNATINLPNGRSAIAAAAATTVITNSLVTAASHVFISPRARDATGLLPLVTTIGAGSFTVTTSANCTATLVFDWLVTA